MKICYHPQVLSVKCFCSYDRVKESTYAKVHGSVSVDALQKKKKKKQKNQLAVKGTTRRSQLLKFIFRKNYYATFWRKMEITDLLDLILENVNHNFVEIFLE